MNIAIQILEEALESASTGLKLAIRHIEKNTSNRPEFYQKSADEYQIKIKDIETAITILRKYCVKDSGEGNTVMSREDYYAKINVALDEVRKRQVHEMLPGETLTDFTSRIR